MSFSSEDICNIAILNCTNLVNKVVYTKFKGPSVQICSVKEALDALSDLDFLSLSSKGIFDTPLIKATRLGKVYLMEELLNRGANINAKSKAGQTALMEAVKNNKIEAVEFLLQQKAEIEAIDISGNTALIIGCINNSSKSVDLLLQNKVEIDTANKDVTPLMYAVSNNATKTAKILINKGANVNLRHEGKTALMKAAIPKVPVPKEIEKSNKITNILITTYIRLAQKSADDLQNFQEQLSTPQVQNALTKETATFLAIALPEGEMRDSVIKSYNKRALTQNLKKGILSEKVIHTLRIIKSEMSENDDFKDNITAQDIFILDLLKGNNFKIITNVYTPFNNKVGALNHEKNPQEANAYLLTVLDSNNGLSQQQKSSALNILGNFIKKQDNKILGKARK